MRRIISPAAPPPAVRGVVATYTRRMSSVADDLRRRTRDQVPALPPAARIELALALGDADLETFARTSGLGAEAARRHLRAGRSRGRPASVANLSP
jgi:hypothetical protein